MGRFFPTRPQRLPGVLAVTLAVVLLSSLTSETEGGSLWDIQAQPDSDQQGQPDEESSSVSLRGNSEIQPSGTSSPVVASISTSFKLPEKYTFPSEKVIPPSKEDQRPYAVLIAGGSFNPITNMHVKMANLAFDFISKEYQVAQVFMEPAHDDYAKQKSSLKGHTFDQRYAIANKRLETEAHVTVDSWPGYQSKYVETTEEVAHVKDEMDKISKDTEVTAMYICGQDLFLSMRRSDWWKAWQVTMLTNEFTVAVLPRVTVEGQTFEEASAVLKGMVKEFQAETSDVMIKGTDGDVKANHIGPNVIVIDAALDSEMSAISSSALRPLLPTKTNQELEAFMPSDTVDLLRKHNWYGTPSEEPSRDKASAGVLNPIELVQLAPRDPSDRGL